jgi:hypothetical protein
MSNGVFFPQAILDILVDAGKVDLEDEQLVLTDGGYRYKVGEAVRILREVATGDDPARLCGKVRYSDELAEQMGAELLGDSLLIEDSAYDVVPGFLGIPVGSANPGSTPELAVLMHLNDLGE